MRPTDQSARGARARINTILGLTYLCILAALGIGLIWHRWVLAFGLLLALAAICSLVALVAVYFGIDWASLRHGNRGKRN